MRSIGRTATIAAALVLTLAFVACGGNDSGDGSSSGSTASTGSTATTGSSGSTGGKITMTIHGFNFDPSEIDVPAGTVTLSITNNDTTTHTFTTDDMKVNEQVGAGGTVQVTLDVTQDLGWHCEIHPSMRGRFVVS